MGIAKGIAKGLGRDKSGKIAIDSEVLLDEMVGGYQMAPTSDTRLVIQVESLKRVKNLFR